ncbi:MAG: citrate/2-methylcitrate synthase, partial [Candidatus Rokuibacteriota bacterium]
VYRVDDARARVLRQMAKTMAEATGHARLFAVAEGVYAAMTARTGLPVNVDFFSAVVYHALGIPGDLCTSIFAVGRVAGWCAHALEQYADNRLIRPRAEYVGRSPRRLVAHTP